MSSSTPPIPPSADPLIGKTVADRFKVTALLARGGMGKVYRAEQSALGRVCALKVLSVGGIEQTDPEFEHRFFLEASICSKLTHPNTVTIFDYGRTDDGVLFMAMEYLEGRTLRDAIQKEAPFDGDRAMHIARQICRSLHEAHGLGVIHRDLKPANVYLMVHADEPDVVKVLDFGLVKNVKSAIGNNPDPTHITQITETGSFMGSPKYMAPEQIKGEAIDGRADLYALGVILYEMVTGKVPFDKPNQVDTLIAHVHEAPPALRAMNPRLDVSDALEGIILRCLAKKPEDRFASMEELLNALKRSTTGTHTAVTTGSNKVARADLVASASLTPAPASFHRTADGAPASPSHPTNGASIPVTAPSTSSSRRWVGVAAFSAVAAVGLIAAIAFRSRPSGESAVTANGGATAAKTTTTTASSASTTTTVVAPNGSIGSIGAAPPAASAVEISVDSEPPGARVLDDQRIVVCDKTPCKVHLDRPSMDLAVTLDGYTTQLLRIVQSDPPRHVTLSPKFAPPSKTIATTHAPTPTEPATATPVPNVTAGPY